MKRLGMVLAIVMLFTMVFSATAMADKGGNGAPGGAHYNLNIIGVENPKTASMTDSNRHTIFVPLNERCNIWLEKAPEGETFQVLDGNCFAGEAGVSPGGTRMMASFMLPDPDPELDGVLNYSVWYRVPPGQKGSAEMTSCYFDTVDQMEYCSTGMTVTLTAKKTFTDVSKNLLTVCANTGTATEPDWEFVPLFSDEGEAYWWQYDNYGLKLAQLRFYPNTSGGEYEGPCTASQTRPYQPR